jgi:hypothetical protein
MRAAAWVVALALGAAHLWMNRRNLRDVDGISYLDMGDALFRGDWSTAVNGLWSPLYAWVLGLAMWVAEPAPLREMYVVQLVNLAVYVGALACLDFLLRQLIDQQRATDAASSAHPSVTLPDWGWVALGNALFLWAALYWIFLWLPDPDIMLAGCIFLAVGLVLRIRTRGASWRRSVALGVVLGVGYLTKSVMLPLGLIVVVLSALAAGDLRKGAPRALLALGVLLTLAAPLVWTLSVRTGRLTIGEAGRINYLWYVNRAMSTYPHWRGEDPGSGTPLHPVRLLAESPRIYEFGTPVGGTYPIWLDPPYWYAGATPHFDAARQIKRLRRSVHDYRLLFCRSPQPALLVGLLALCALGWRAAPRVLARQWPLWVPALAGLAAYAMIKVEDRYAGPFVILLWLALLAAVRLPATAWARGAMASVTAGMVAVILVPACVWTVPDLVRNRPPRPEFDAAVHWEVATGLRRLGVAPGDRVTVVGSGLGAARWARLARVKIVAELPWQDQAQFWSLDPAARTRLLATFARTGAEVVVADGPPDPLATVGWRKLGETGRYAYVLRR